MIKIRVLHPAKLRASSTKKPVEPYIGTMAVKSLELRMKNRVRLSKGMSKMKIKRILRERKLFLAAYGYQLSHF
ncbi:MAG: hypothetical protein ACYDBH_24515 [Acidobacteriaceae bacterium]